MKFKTRINFSDFISDKMVWIGVVLSVLYWVLGAVFESFILHFGNFTDRLIFLKFHEFLIRLFIVFLLISFSVYAQLIINRRKQAEKTLQRGLKESQSIFDTSPIPLVVVNPDLRVQRANKATQRFVGQTEEEMLGRPEGDVFRCFHAYDVPEGCGFGPVCMDCRLRNTVLATFRTREPLINVDTELTLMRGEEYSLRNMLFSTSYFVGSAGPRVIIALEDVTDSKQAHERLEQALESARQAEKVKSLFLANMSHEIRTPLNAILGFTDLLETRTGSIIGEEERGFFDIIRNSGNRLMKTVHEILDISQIEAGTYRLRKEKLDLVKEVRSLVEECRIMAEEKKLALEFHSGLKSAYIRADRYGISQAVNNILDNAIKYTEKGGVSVTLTQKAEYYLLSIEDTGIGISEEYIDNIFEIFSQESEGYTKKFQGIGLGMAIAKRHLELNQVKVKVASTKGGGTVFSLAFQPLEERVPEEPIEQEPAGDVSTPEPDKKLLLLLVEDDLSSRKLIEFYFKGKHNVCFAVSVNEAREQLKKQPVDLILLDLSLVGNEDGLDLARHLRKTREWRNIPIIALTAHAFTKDRENCLAAGCNDYLTKPVRREKLLEKINEYV
ncbi:MAG: response regulator [FCB group bacterium]|nr:response regulator [FCB group bacterium]